MKKFAKALAVVVCVAAATGAMAQEKKLSISAQGNYSKADNSPANGMATVGLGYLATPNLEVGISASVLFSGSGSSSSTITTTQLQGQYYLSPVGKANQVIPYGKASYGMVTGSGADVSLYGVGVGVSYSLSESSEAFVEAAALTAKASGSSSFNETGINFGLKFRF